MVTTNGHAPLEALAPPVIVADNQEEPDARAGFPDTLAWSPLSDFADRLTDLYVAVNHAFHRKGVVPDHAMMESLVRATMQSKYAEWITDPTPPSFFGEETPYGRERNRGDGSTTAAAGARAAAGEPAPTHLHRAAPQRR